MGKIYERYNIKTDYFNTQISVEIENEQKIINEIELEINNNFNKATKELMMNIMDTVQKLCPVDTGFLKSTGRLVKRSTGYNIVYTAPYSKYVIANYNWIYLGIQLELAKINGTYEKLYEEIFYTDAFANYKSIKEQYEAWFEAVNSVMKGTIIR